MVITVSSRKMQTYAHWPSNSDRIHDSKVHKLQCIQEKKYLGVYIANTLKPRLQCHSVPRLPVSKAMSVLSLINR